MGKRKSRIPGKRLIWMWLGGVGACSATGDDGRPTAGGSYE